MYHLTILRARIRSGEQSDRPCPKRKPDLSWQPYETQRTTDSVAIVSELEVLNSHSGVRMTTIRCAR